MLFATGQRWLIRGTMAGTMASAGTYWLMQPLWKQNPVPERDGQTVSMDGTWQAFAWKQVPTSMISDSPIANLSCMCARQMGWRTLSTIIGMAANLELPEALKIQVFHAWADTFNASA